VISSSATKETLMRRVYAGSALVAHCAGAGLLSSGCGSNHTWAGSSSGGSGYYIASQACDGRVFLVVAANGCSGGSFQGGGPTAKGELAAHDGRRIPWSCSTRDGAEGTVKIDGQAFDLTKGGLLLVRTNGQQTQVEQLAVDLSKLKGGPLREQVQS